MRLCLAKKELGRYFLARNQGQLLLVLDLGYCILVEANLFYLLYHKPWSSVLFLPSSFLTSRGVQSSNALHVQFSKTPVNMRLQVPLLISVVLECLLELASFVKSQLGEFEEDCILQLISFLSRERPFRTKLFSGLLTNVTVLAQVETFCKLDYRSVRSPAPNGQTRRAVAYCLFLACPWVATFLSYLGDVQ